MQSSQFYDWDLSSLFDEEHHFPVSDHHENRSSEFAGESWNLSSLFDEEHQFPVSVHHENCRRELTGESWNLSSLFNEEHQFPVSVHHENGSSELTETYRGFCGTYTEHQLDDDWNLSSLFNEEHQFPGSVHHENCRSELTHESHRLAYHWTSWSSSEHQFPASVHHENRSNKLAGESLYDIYAVDHENRTGESSGSFCDICAQHQLDDEWNLSSLFDEEHQFPVSVHHENCKRKLTSEFSRSFCDICVEDKHIGQMFTTNNCTHLFCKVCVAKYIAAKLQGNISLVKCPDMNCNANLEPQICREIVSIDLFERWQNALCESLIPGFEKFFCPFKDCSAMLVDDGGEILTACECPYCHRLFCAQCKTSWHSNMNCSDFQKYGKDIDKQGEELLKNLAKMKKWRNCPNCKYFVEKTSGCMHIICRCKFEFCYGCGAKWTVIHNCQ